MNSEYLIYLFYNVLGLIVGMLLYRFGIIEGQKLSKGLPIKSFIEKKNDGEAKKIKKDEIVEGWENIMSYTGEPQKREEE
jgi:hypothetical protein